VALVRTDVLEESSINRVERMGNLRTTLAVTRQHASVIVNADVVAILHLDDGGNTSHPR
jgi:hypothetical protein